jgi:serine/threonine-protein kinase
VSPERIWDRSRFSSHSEPGAWARSTGLAIRASGRIVAVKVLRPDVAADPERIERFEREARAASALNHPNIVTIYDVGVEGGMSYIAMELVGARRCAISSRAQSRKPFRRS